METSATDEILRSVFQAVDVDGSSSVDKKELLKALMFNENVAKQLHKFPHLVPLLKPKHYQQTFMAMDTSHDHQISMEEFIAFASGFTFEESMDQLFSAIDIGEVGKVQKAGLLESLMNSKECLTLMESYDRLHALKDLEPSQVLKANTVDKDWMTKEEFVDFVTGFTNSFESSSTYKSRQTSPPKAPERERKMPAIQMNGEENAQRTLFNRVWLLLKETGTFDMDDMDHDFQRAKVPLRRKNLQSIVERWEKGEFNRGDGKSKFMDATALMIRKNEHELSEQAGKDGNQAWQIKNLFQEFDHDRTGLIDVDKLYRMVNELAVANPELEFPTNERDLKRAFETLDTDNSGEIDENEFTQWIIGGLKKSNSELERFAAKSDYHLRMKNFICSIKRALVESPKEYFRARIHSLFKQFVQAGLTILDASGLGEMLMYLNAYRPDVDLPHSKEDIQLILQDLGSDGLLNEDEFVDWIHDGISQAPENLLDFAKSSPFNSRMTNFLDAVRSWLREDSLEIQKGENSSGLFGDIERRIPQIKRLFGELLTINEDGVQSNCMDAECLKLMIYEIGLGTPDLELPFTDEAEKVLYIFDTNKDGKVEMSDFVEYMTAELTMSASKREKIAEESPFNRRMDNLVVGLINALDNDPMNEMHSRFHEFFDEYHVPGSKIITVSSFRRMCTDLSNYVESTVPFPKGKDDALKLLTAIGGTDEIEQGGVHEEIFISWLDKGLLQSRVTRAKIKEKSEFHAKTITFLETLLAFIKTHPSNYTNGKTTTCTFPKGRMGISINETVDDDGNVYLTLCGYSDDSPAAFRDDIEEGMEITEVNDDLLINAGFKQLKAILSNIEGDEVKMKFRSVDYQQTYKSKSESSSRRKNVVKLAHKNGAFMVVFNEGPIGLSFDESIDGDGKPMISIIGISKDGQAAKCSQLQVGQRLFAVGAHSVEGMNAQSVIEMLLRSERPLEMLILPCTEEEKNDALLRSKKREEKEEADAASGLQAKASISVFIYLL